MSRKQTFLFYMILGILLMIPCVTAYSTTNLKAYYSFDGTNYTNITDNVANQNLIGSGASAYTGIKNNASNSATSYNATLNYDISDDDFSINFWINYTGITNTQTFFKIANDTSVNQYIITIATTSSIGLTYCNHTIPATTAYCKFSGGNPSTTGWSMITITYDGTTIKYYLNGILITSNSSENVRPNSNIIGIGSHTAIRMDELSVWNTELNIFDITQIYNIGTGYNYSQTINNTLSNTTAVCIDDYNLCNNPIIIFDEYYCDVLDTSYCDTGCINQNISGIITGSCNTSLCTNECNILHYQDCTSSTSFAICGNYDTDTCLEYSGDFGCMIGEVCKNGYCASNNYTGDNTNNCAFTVTPYATNDESTTYTVDSQNKKVTINTKNYAQNQAFNTLTSCTGTYSSRTCAYAESLLYSQVSDVINSSTSYTTTSNIGVTSYTEINLLPNDLTNSTIIIKDSIGNELTSLTLWRNSTNKETCVYYNTSSTLLFCDYSVNSYDDLQNIKVRIDFEMQSKTYTYSITFDKVQDSTLYSYPQLFTSTDYNTIQINSSNTTLNSIKIYSYTQPKGFTTTLTNNYDYLRCTYSQKGCNVVRTYNNDNGVSDFTNYYDYTVCINALGLSSTDISDSQDDTKLTTAEKRIIWSFALTFFFAILIGALLGVTTRNGAVAFLGFAITVAGGLILFGALQWISVIYIIILAILDVIAIVVAFKMLFFTEQ